MHDRATAQRTAVQLKSGGRRLLRKVISSKIGAGSQRIDESGAPSARIPGRGFEVAPTLGPPIKGTAAEDAQSCTSARTILGDDGQTNIDTAFTRADSDFSMSLLKNWRTLVAHNPDFALDEGGASKYPAIAAAVATYESALSDWKEVCEKRTARDKNK